MVALLEYEERGRKRGGVERSGRGVERRKKRDLLVGFIEMLDCIRDNNKEEQAYAYK